MSLVTYTLKTIRSCLLGLKKAYEQPGYLTDRDQRLFGATRSTHWSAVRAQHLKDQPECQACGSTDDPEVHHMKPFHLHPELELDPTNLITLCGSRGCHFTWGHFYDWHRFNPDVIADTAAWKKKAAPEN